MSLDARLTKLMPGLSARERAILVLRSLKEKTPEDPLWRRTMPQEQARECRRLILMNACNIYLPLYITVVEQKTEHLCLKRHWHSTLLSFGLGTWRLGELVPPNKRKQAAKAVAQFFPVIELPWDEAEHELSWINVSDGMWEALRTGVSQLWEDVRAIDTVVDSVAVEFDGEDPLRPIMRGVLEATRKKLTALHEYLSIEEPLALPEPSEEVMEIVQNYFDNGKRLMEGL